MGETLLTADDLKRTLGRMAHEVLEKHKGAANLVVIGVLKSGFPVAKRLAFAMTQIEGSPIPCGSLDIRAYRDDRNPSEQISDETEIPFSVADKAVILVDEVIQTGRTVRAAMDALIHHGRPHSIELATLIDRGGRELPIEPNYVGKRVEVQGDEYVIVDFDSPQEDGVHIEKGVTACTS
jgi:pyrimidine operon attenuation protein/uracil phosphoribosyltransferase